MNFAAPPSTCLGKPADAGIHNRAAGPTHHRPRAGHSTPVAGSKTALPCPIWLALGHAHHRGCVWWSDRRVLQRPAEEPPISEIQSQDRWPINLEGTPTYLLNCARAEISGFPHKSHFFTACPRRCPTPPAIISSSNRILSTSPWALSTANLSI